MPIKVSDLAKNKAEVEVKWHDTSCIVKYKPGLLTSARIDSMIESEFGLQEFIASTVTSWDVTERKANKDVMFPLVAKRLEELPSPFLRAVMSAMLSDGSDVGEAVSNSSGG